MSSTCPTTWAATDVSLLHDSLLPLQLAKSKCTKWIETQTSQITTITGK
ncbi:hypothetical protein [Moheibacter sediminis]|nr:hypothetical protein [Moheibacter sediminis]